MLHDRDIREPLFAFLEQRYGKIRILEEKTMGRSRADIVMVTPGQICGIEIKSDADGYTRLARQIRDYDRYFDRNFCAVGVSHAAHIEEHLPPYWGIITAEQTGDGGLDFYMMRRPRPNPNADIRLKLTLLWRPEVTHILERCHLPTLKTVSKARSRERLLEWVPEALLHRLISDELFERDYTLIAEEIDRYRKEQGRPARKRRKAKPAGRKSRA